MIVLALLENVQNKVTGFFRTYGRVPMFYYILHFYIIHTIAIIVFFAQGFSTSEIVTKNNPFLFNSVCFSTLVGSYDARLLFWKIIR